MLDLDYAYGTTQNNGNVLSQTITVPTVGATPGFTAVQNYDYDSLNRIQIASETLTPTAGAPETWTQDFRYDRYGNRTFHEPTTTTLPKECNNNTEVCAAIRPIVNPSVSPSNNRLNGYSFDAAGNTTRPWILEHVSTIVEGNARRDLGSGMRASKFTTAIALPPNGIVNRSGTTGLPLLSR